MINLDPSVVNTWGKGGSRETGEELFANGITQRIFEKTRDVSTAGVSIGTRRSFLMKKSNYKNSSVLLTQLLAALAFLQCEKFNLGIAHYLKFFFSWPSDIFCPLSKPTVHVLVDEVRVLFKYFVNTA